MNKDKYKKSLDNIKPSDELVRKTIMLINEKKAKKFVFPIFYLGLVCSCVFIVMVSVIIGNNTGGSNSSDNTNYLIDSKDDYTLGKFVDFDKLSNSDLMEIDILKYGDDIKDNVYISSYDFKNVYINMVDLLSYFKDNSLVNFDGDISLYHRIIINNEYYFYVSINDYEIVLSYNNAYYSIDASNYIDYFNGIVSLIGNVSDKRLIVNFMEQTDIGNIPLAYYHGMYVISSYDNNKWLNYRKVNGYDDYKLFISYLEKIKNNHVNIYYDDNVLDDFVDNKQVYIDSHYCVYVKSDKVLVYDKGLPNKIYYVIDLTDNDLDVLNSMIDFIDNKGEYEKADNNITGNHDVDNLMILRYGFSYGKVWLGNSGGLYITFDDDNIKNIKDNEYAPLDTSLLVSFKDYLISSNVSSVDADFVGKNDYPVVAYIVDGKVYILKIEDVIKSGNTACSNLIELGNKASKVEYGTDDEGFVKLFVILEDGSRLQIEI